MTHYIYPGLDGITQKAYRFSLPANRAFDITSFIFEHLNVSENFITSMDRKREHVFARQLSMYLIRKHTKASYKSIGQFFGNRDHSSVIFAIGQVENDIQTNKHLRERIENIFEEFKQYYENQTRDTISA